MILYLLKCRAINAFKYYFSSWKSIPLVMISLIMVIYGWILGAALNDILPNDGNLFTREYVLNVVLFSIFVSSLTRLLVSGLKTKPKALPAYYPLSVLTRYTYSVCSDFFSPYFVFTFLFITSASLFMPEGGLHFWLAGTLAIISGMLLKKCLQYLTDYKLRWQGYGIYILIALFIALVYTFTEVRFYPLNPVNIIYTPLLFGFGFLLELNVIERKLKKRKEGRKGLLNYPSVKLIMENKPARTALLTGTILKTVILAANCFANHNENPFEESIVNWLFVSPLFLFTYVFNNSLGFWKNVWLRFELGRSEHYKLITLVLQILLFPFLTDMVLSVAALLYLDYRPLFIVSFYLTASLFLFSFCILWSILFPSPIKSTLKNRGTTSVWSSLISVGAILVLTLVRKEGIFYSLVPLFALVSFMGLYLAITMYKERRYQIAEKLLKNDAVKN